ncbi:hypothetical protein IE077_003470 [Cardiosporidium cionae]|uniref:Uncharacterized protein n=1 Tax=Cardiosporidium cionae TaxID=476202 RepID=A0ABQ7J857_9APIC|nr:hypothetical protein IE077_003470 [Cardiosporidium cionae]|eukprot:KAF8820178.1 hypothetical protein IE077_003470 [Cardiosporidium cionae]
MFEKTSLFLQQHGRESVESAMETMRFSVILCLLLTWQLIFYSFNQRLSLLTFGIAVSTRRQLHGSLKKNHWTPVIIQNSRCAKRVPSLYVNFNFPVGRSLEDIPLLHPAPRMIILLNSIFAGDTKQTLLLFGKLAEHFYPDTPEQIAKVGEPYSYNLLGTPFPWSHSVADVHSRKPVPKWECLFNAQAGGEITRMQFQSRLANLPFKWPLFKNQTVVQSQLYNLLVEQNLQSLEVVSAFPKEKKGNDEGSDYMADVLKKLSHRTKYGSFPAVEFSKVKPRNPSDNRALIHNLFSKEKISSYA